MSGNGALHQGLSRLHQDVLQQPGARQNPVALHPKDLIPISILWSIDLIGNRHKLRVP